MKCKYCGAEVGLEENYCKYCGRPNEQAVRHAQDMASYHRHFAATEAAVVNKTNRYRQIVLRIALIFTLVILTLVMYAVANHAYSIPETLRRRAAEKDPALTVSRLDAYLDARDYMSFVSYMDYCDLRTFGSAPEAFSKYSRLHSCAYYYQDFVLRMESLLLHTDREDWQKYNADSDIRWLCQAMDDFISDYNRTSLDGEDPFSAPYLEDMYQTMMEMLHVYLGIDESEREGFLSLSLTKKAAVVEEVLVHAQQSD